MLRTLALLWLMYCSVAFGQSAADTATTTGSYRLEWRRHYDLHVGLVPTGVSDDEGTLWLVTSGRGTDDALTRIHPDRTVAGTYLPTLPLDPFVWVNYLSPAVTGSKVGLLANLVSGGQQQTFEGAFFIPVGPTGLGRPVRVAGRGPQFTAMVGVGNDEFLAAGDQSPLTLLKLNSTGTVQWRHSYSGKLVLPTVSVGSSGTIYVLSQGGSYLLLQILDASGALLRLKRITGKQGMVVADAEGGCTILFTTGYGGRDNPVHMLTLDRELKQLIRIETPLDGWDGRSYALISSPRGHLIIGEIPQRDPQRQITSKIVAEVDRSGKLIWQKAISSLSTPLLASFRTGFYIVRDAFDNEGIDIEKYVESAPAQEAR